MENPSPKEENIVKDVRNIFRLEKLKKEAIDIKIKDTRNPFRLEKRIKQLETKYLNRFLEWKKNKEIKDIIFRGIRNLFENEKEGNFYKPVRVSNFLSNNYIEYESNGDRNKTLSVEEYLDEIRPYLKDIINNLKNSDTCKEKFVKKNLKTNIFKIKKKPL